MTGKTDTKAANDAAATDEAEGGKALTAEQSVQELQTQVDSLYAEREFLTRGLRDRGVSEDKTDADGFNPIEEALRQIDYYQREGEALKRQLAAQKGATTRVRNQAAALEAEMPKKPRDFRAELDVSQSEALELIEDADKVELAFVTRDGREVPNLAPRDLTGVSFSIGRQRLRPDLSELKVHGPEQGKPPHQIAGYVLLADGEPVAKVRRSDVLTIGAGQTMELKGDVIF